MSADKVIVITSENHIKDEADLWVKLFELGIGKIHVRKPAMDTEGLLQLIQTVPSVYHKQLVIHHDINVALQNGVAGLHLPYTQLIKGKILQPDDMTLSASVHTWQEAEVAMKLCSYCFISPVFSSISKNGYAANPELSSVPDHLKGKRVYALGGVESANLRQSLAMGYYGVAVLGTIWNDPLHAVDKAQELLELTTEKTEYI